MIFSSKQVTRWVAILCLLLGPQCARGQDPTRFFAVKAWRGAFTHSVDEKGSQEGYMEPNATLHWVYTHNVQTTAKLDLASDTATHPYYRFWFSTTNLSETIEVDEQVRWVVRNPDGSTDTMEWRATPDREYPPVGFSISVNSNERTYTVGFPAGSYINALVELVGLGLPPNPASFPFAGEASITFPLPASGLTLAGNARFPLRRPMTAIRMYPTEEVPLSDVEVSWTIVPDFEDVEVLIDPLGNSKADYAHWLPEGDLKDWREPGNIMNVVAYLRTKDGGIPQSRAQSFRFELTDVSHEPGVCLNFPLKAFANTDPDLMFETNFVSESMIWVSPSVVTNIPGSYLEARATISSFDFGAHCMLKVTAIVNGREIIGHLKDDSFILQPPIPKTSGNSFVAESWKQKNGASAWADDADLDNQPLGDMHNGDGLSLYEEYRGFSENGKHLRTDPRKKDLFVLDTIRTLGAKQGLLMFGEGTHIEVHHELRPPELGGVWPAMETLINFNSGRAHVVDQHGLHLLQGTQEKGYSIAEGPGNGNSTPGSKTYVLISPGITSTVGLHEMQPDGKALITVDLRWDGYAATVAHELAHCCSVYHHGEVDETVEWEKNASGTGILEDGVPIRIFDEAGQGWLIVSTNVVLGAKHGQHSGNDQCFMRYSNAWAYESNTDSGVRYWVAEDEFEGHRLCTSGKGTGINASAAGLPWPRYGDADPGRGNCTGQICVNDFYVNSPMHKR